MSRFLEAENNMFDEILPYVVGHDAADDPVAPLRAFVGENRDALIHAAALLGGRRGARLALGVADDLASPRALTRRTRRQIDALLDILALEHVHDDEREECGRFAALDPASPLVEELCLLTDGFRDAITEADLDHPSASPWADA